MGNGQWAVGSCQLSVGSAPWKVDSGQWSVGNGNWAVGSGQCNLTIGPTLWPGLKVSAGANLTLNDILVEKQQ